MVAFSDLVVVVPGILGSRLVRREGPKTRVVWDFSIRHLPQTLYAAATGGLFVKDNDGVEADSLFNYQLLPGFFGVDDYDSLVETLTRLAGETQVVTLPYDWRKSNRVAAQTLATTVDAGLRRLRQAGAKNPKAWLIAHSMGGLVARYYCEHLGGAASTRAVVTIGTPHRGSVNALDALVNGKRYGLIDLGPFIRSMPSVYELLPLFPVLRTGEGSDRRLVRIAEAFNVDPITGEDIADTQGQPTPPASHPIPGLDRGMLQDALRFHAAIRIPAEAREAGGHGSEYLQRVIFNRRQHTAHSARPDGNKLTIYQTYPVLENGDWREDDARGDGTVPAQSAVPIEWEDTADAIPNAQKHTGIQATPEAQDVIRNWLVPAKTRGFKGGGDELDMIVLDVPPIVDTATTVPVTVSAGRSFYGNLLVTDVSTGAEAAQPVPITTEPRTIELESLPPGVHKITASPRDLTKPSVSDYVYVAGAEG